MLKLLVVDDEMVILQGIVKIIREAKTPFILIETALDAIEALSIVPHFQPDLIITDINMPELNGLDFIQKVKQRKWCKRFIILTGYDEFAYAKQAIQMQVIDYLLKPIDKYEMVSLLHTISKEIIEEQGAWEKQQNKHESEYCRHVEMMLSYIANHYHQDLSLIQLSELTGLHPNYISQLFKRETGVAFIQYLHGIRIEKAKQLLLSNHALPVQTIGNQVGFENPQHFMKVFKKLTGFTPGAYRESQNRT